MSVPLELSTSRFGTIQIPEEQLITIPLGIIGFPEDRRYVLIEHKKDSPFMWLQSADNGTLAFVLTDPFLFVPDYQVEVSPDDRAALELNGMSEGLQTLVIVNISQAESREVTANLLGPVLVNFRKRLGRQVILHHRSYSHRHPLPIMKK